MEKIEHGSYGEENEAHRGLPLGVLHSEAQSWRLGQESEQSSEEAADLTADMHKGKQDSGEVLGTSCIMESARKDEELVYHCWGGGQTNQT